MESVRPGVDYTQRSDGVAHVLLNRPERLNALDGAAKRELARIWRDAAADPAVRAVVLSGAGDRAFSSGSDLKEMQAAGAMVSTELLLESIPNIGVPIDKPVLAACHGYTIGTGLTMAMHCDIRLAAPNTQFGFPDTPNGMIAGFACLTLPRLLGHGPAMEIMLSGRNFGAQEALGLRLVHRVVDGDVLEAAFAQAARLASYPPVAMAESKRLMMLEMREQVRRFLEEVTRSRQRVQDAKFAQPARAA